MPAAVAARVERKELSTLTTRPLERTALSALRLRKAHSQWPLSHRGRTAHPEGARVKKGDGNTHVAAFVMMTVAAAAADTPDDTFSQRTVPCERRPRFLCALA